MAPQDRSRDVVHRRNGRLRRPGRGSRNVDPGAARVAGGSPYGVGGRM